MPLESGRKLLSEDRIYAHVDTRIADVMNRVKLFQEKMNDSIERQGVDVAKEMAKLEQKIGPGPENKLRDDLARIESGINVWIQNVETQLNVNFIEKTL